MARRRLDTWKEIAVYLGRDVTTVRRWEKREGLPIRRHVHDKLGSVYAFADEVDDWSAGRSKLVEPDELAGAPPQASDPAPDLLEPFAWRTALGIVIVVAVVLAAAMRFRTPPASVDEVPVVPIALAPPPGVIVHSLSLSPDGTLALFAGRDSAGARIWIRSVASLTSEALAGTDGGSFPFWSADGGQFGFFAQGRLKAITIATREVRDLADAPEGLGGTWNKDGDIVFAPDRGAGLAHVNSSGGQRRQITRVANSFKEGHAWPEFLPDGRHFLYTDCAADQNRFGIYVGDLDTGRTKRILPVYSNASYSPRGFLLFARESLMAQPFDLADLKLVGEAKPVADTIVQWYDIGFHADFSVSRSGPIAVRSGERDLTQLRWVDRRTGQETGRLGAPSWYSNPTLSPDETHVVATVDDDKGVGNLWMFDAANGQAKRASFGSPVDFAPLWWPRREEILFATPRGLFRQGVDAGGDPVPVFRARMMQTPESWSADGRYLTVHTISRATKTDIWAWRVGDHARAFPVRNTPANEGQSQISPDGRYLAFVSDESGRFEVYVQTFPDPGARWQISTGGGADPKWRADGRELFFVGADRRMMAVDVSLKPAFSRGRVVALFPTQLESLWMDTRNHYDVTHDGQRFVMIAPVADRREAPFTMLVNWKE